MFSTMERLTNICSSSAFVYLMLATLFKIFPCGYGNLSYTVMEEVAINTLIADVKTCKQTNTTEEIVFGFLTTAQRYDELFHIADDTGLLLTSKTIDRETICLHRVMCVLELQVYVNGTSNGFHQICNISVKIDDINDNSPVFPVPSISINIPENDAIGKSVDISDNRADDHDYGLLGVQTYSILSNTSPLPFSVSFNGNNTLLLILNRPLDREYVALYNFLIVATDGGIPPRSASLSVSIYVTDVNDNKPLFTVPSYHVNIGKYQPVNSTILHLSAVDHDAGVNGEVHYALNPSQNIDILERFYIDAAGDLLLTTPLVDKTQEDYTISVIAFDLGQPSLRTFINIYVEIMTPNITAGGVSVTNYDAFLSAEKGSWSQSGDMCKDNPAGGSLFQECQPGTCKPELLKRAITGLTDDEATMWINGYVLRSSTMQYYGCYGIAKSLKNSTIQALQYKENIPDNNVLQCSSFCSPHGKFILLMANWCYCLSKSVKNQWTNNLFTFDEVSTNLCNVRCPGDDNYYCGKSENHMERTIYLSVYMYKYQSFTPDPIYMELGLHCFYVERRGNNRTVRYTNCNEQRKFECQEVQMTGDHKKWETACYHQLLNWYEARSKCTLTETFLQAYAPSTNLCDNNKEVDLNDTWHNRFIVEKIIWETDGYPNQNADNADNCLAMKKTVDGNIKLLTRNCNEEYPALCEINDATTVKTETPIMSTHTSSRDQPDNTTSTDRVITGLDNTTVIEEEPASNDDPGNIKWYIAVIVVVIVVILSIIGICILWKRWRKSFYSKREKCDNVRNTLSDAKRNTAEYDEIDYNKMQCDNAEKSGGATDHDRQLVQQQLAGGEGSTGTEYTEMNIIGAVDMQEYIHMYQPLKDNRQSDSHMYSSVNQKVQSSDFGNMNIQCVEASNETSNTNEFTYENQAEHSQANNINTLNLWRELYANLPDNSRSSLTEASKKDVKKGKKGLKT